MGIVRRTFAELSFEEKLTIVSDYLGSIKETDSKELLSERMEWLRRHIPAYNGGDEGNYVFISYSHRDFKPVYSDLAFFSYNNRKKVRFWYDEGLPAGDDWFLAANERLNDPHCVGVIFYLSENFLRSSAVLQEIELVKRLNKPYFTIALENGKFCAADYLNEDADAELLRRVESVFPREETSVSYGSDSSKLFPEAETAVAYDDEYENAFYRIQKIEQTFSVVEELFSDFVFEEAEDGLRLTEYRGDETIVYIPERIGRQPVTELCASFDHARELYIPATVKRISPVVLKEEVGVVDVSFAVFGRAKNLDRIDVDPRNPVFYDKDGVLLDRKNTLIRVPANHPWDDQYLEGVETIGDSAFYRYENPQANIMLPPTVTAIEEGAFAFAKVFCVFMNEGIRTIEKYAFSFCSVGFPLSVPETVESLGSFVFSHAEAPFITVDGEHLEEIPTCAFFRYNGDYVDIPKNVKAIRNGAFQYCDAIESLKLPESLEVIEDAAFADCTKLHHINIPRGVRYLSPTAFDGAERLKYILYGGNAREFYYLRKANDLEKVKYPELFITKDDWFGRLRTKLFIAVRKQVIKALEKESPDMESGKKKTHFGKITFSAVFAFLLTAFVFFALDYRRLVLQRSPDVIYWLFTAINVFLSYSGSKHLYWSYVVNRHRRGDRKKTKPNQIRSDFFDAYISVLSIACIAYGLLALLITLLVIGIFGVSIPL